MYTNADTLTNKGEELAMLAREKDYDVIIVTEILPKNLSSFSDVLKTNPKDVCDSFVLPGFKSFSCSEGRGVVIFVKDSLDCTRVSELDVFIPCVFIKIILSDVESILVGGVYRSPSSTAEDNDNLNTLINNAVDVAKGQKLVIAGDFNFPEIRVRGTCAASESHGASKFLETVGQNYLEQLVLEPTHYRVLQSPTLIDLVLTNTDAAQIQESLPPLGKSHHVVIQFEIKSFYNDRENGYETSRFKLAEGDYEAMRKFLGEIDWERELRVGQGVDDCWFKIKTHILHAMQKFVPCTKAKSRPRKKNGTLKGTVPHTLLDKIRLKRKEYKNYKKYRTQDSYNAYTRARNQVKWLTRKMVRERETKLAKEVKENPKSFFHYVSNKIKPKDSVPNLMKGDGKVTENSQEKANVLNSFFTSVFTDEPEGNVPNFKCTKNVECISEVNVSEEMMFKALKKINPNKSPGPDKIHPRVLLELAKELSLPFTILFNLSMTKGTLPKEWKLAEVRPIFKKGDRCVPGNYRPVSLTSVVCKIFEGFIRDKLNTHLKESELLAKEQFGFSEGRSCVTNLLNTVNDWMTRLDDGIPIDVVYI